MEILKMLEQFSYAKKKLGMRCQRNCQKLKAKGTVPQREMYNSTLNTLVKKETMSNAKIPR